MPILVKTPCVGMGAGHILGVLRLALAPGVARARSGLRRFKWVAFRAALNVLTLYYAVRIWAFPSCLSMMITTVGAREEVERRGMLMKAVLAAGSIRRLRFHLTLLCSILSESRAEERREGESKDPEDMSRFHAASGSFNRKP
jgi:hypothetical protein